MYFSLFLFIATISHHSPSVYVYHYREDCFIQRTWAKGAGNQLSTGLHWCGAERDQQAWI